MPRPDAKVADATPVLVMVMVNGDRYGDAPRVMP
jgi:hypothetical protein